MSEKIKLIIDHIGRFILGKVVGETDEYIQLKTPLIIHVQPNPQTNQLQVQNIPLLFNEFVAKSETNIWTFSKKSIAVSDVELDARLVSQYHAMVDPQPLKSEPEVIKLFDD
jgi:hypothetical protein